MLTRLKVSGFKNLIDVDVRFGPFTCIAGANGTGKSNLFDAIRFLSALADRPLLEAAQSVRDDDLKTTDVKSLFHRLGDDCDPQMSFEAEIIIPSGGNDDLGQPAKASITFLRYTLNLAYREGSIRQPPSLEVVREELVHITRGEANRHILFPHNAKKWRNSAIIGERRTSHFISTEEQDNTRHIRLHQDRGGGRPSRFLASALPRTVLSASNASESPTVLLARREMQSWRLLQLEPSALRKPDPFTAPVRLSNDGAHLAATLYHLAWHRDDAPDGDNEESEAKAARVYAEVANRLAELINEVREVYVDRDEKHELFTLYVKGRDKTAHPARALSDGTLRFLALAVLERDPDAKGLICLEELENGIHPDRIPAILRLLQDIATKTDEPVSVDNPLRQVIVNTHSPAVVMQVPDDSLLMAELVQTNRGGRQYTKVRFLPMEATWRAKAGATGVSRGRMLSYLDPASLAASSDIASLNEHPIKSNGNVSHPTPRSRRVMDRDDIKQLRLMLFTNYEELSKGK